MKKCETFEDSIKFKNKYLFEKFYAWLNFRTTQYIDFASQKICQDKVANRLNTWLCMFLWENSLEVDFQNSIESQCNSLLLKLTRRE